MIPASLPWWALLIILVIGIPVCAVVLSIVIGLPLALWQRRCDEIEEANDYRAPSHDDPWHERMRLAYGIAMRLGMDIAVLSDPARYSLDELRSITEILQRTDVDGQTRPGRSVSP